MYKFNKDKVYDNQYLQQVEKALNSPSNVDKNSGFPNQDKMVQCGKLLLQHLNCNDISGAFCMVSVLNTERSYLYGGATHNLDLWRSILECISNSLPEHAYVGRISIGLAIHVWGNNAEKALLESIKVFTHKLERMPLNDIFSDKNISLFLPSHSGYVIYPQDTGYLDNFIPITRYAAIAALDMKQDLFQSKQQQFRAELLDKINTSISDEKYLIKSIFDDSFVLYYQSQHDLVTNELIGVEALARWSGNGLSFSKTYDYICLIEEGQYITNFTEVSFHKLVEFFKKYQPLFPVGFQLSFNLSPAVFKWPNFDLLKMIKHEVDLVPDLIPHLIIEITESAYTNKTTSAIAVKTLKQIKDLGIQISIDDFGSGYGALQLLASNIPTCIKLDRELTTAFCVTASDKKSYIKNLIHTANFSGLSVLCEGIETLQQKNFLTKQGVFIGQGYFYSKPLKETDFIAHYKNNLTSLVLS